MLKWFYSPKLIKKRKIRGQKQLLHFSFRSQYCFLCCCMCLLDSNRGLFGLHYSTISEIFFLIWFKNLCLLKSVNAVPRTSLFYRLFQSRIAQSLTVTKLDCYKVAKSFTLKIFDFLYSGVLFSYGPLKLIIVNVLFGIFTVLSIIWVRICAYSWQPYRRWDPKMAEYYVFKSFVSTWDLILAKKVFALLSLNVIVSILKHVFVCVNIMQKFMSFFA